MHEITKFYTAPVCFLQTPRILRPGERKRINCAREFDEMTGRVLGARVYVYRYVYVCVFAITHACTISHLPAAVMRGGTGWEGREKYVYGNATV